MGHISNVLLFDNCNEILFPERTSNLQSPNQMFPVTPGNEEANKLY